MKSSTELNLEPFITELFLIVDKLHFWHLLRFTNNLNDLQAVIFGIMLPRNKMIKLV